MLSQTKPRYIAGGHKASRSFYKCHYFNWWCHFWLIHWDKDFHRGFLYSYLAFLLSSLWRVSLMKLMLTMYYKHLLSEMHLTGMNTKMGLWQFVEFYYGLLLNAWNQAFLNDCIVLKTVYILLCFCPIKDKPLCLDIIVVFVIIHVNFLQQFAW